MAPREAAPALPLLVAAGSASLLLGLASCGSLARFLYEGPRSHIFNNNINNAEGDADGLRWRDVCWGVDALWPLLFDLGLVCCLLLLLRVLAAPWVQRGLAAACGVCRRAVHVSCAAIAVQLLIHLWEPGRALPPLWSVRGELAHSTCFLVHVLSWLVMLSIAIIFDFPELMGIKQMYYEAMGLGEPMLLKSRRAQRLYGHMRVPVLVEALLVLWVVPRMSAERALLSLLASAYLATAHRLDARDYEYLRGQLARKFEVFRREERRLALADKH